jgi:hypothetical protein
MTVHSMLGHRSRVDPSRPRKRYAIYRCSAKPGDCPHEAAISATLVEQAVVAEVQRLLEGEYGSATLSDKIAEAEADAVRARQVFEAAIQAFAGLDPTNTQKRLRELEQEMATAAARFQQLRAAAGPAARISATGDWHELSFEGQRRLIRATLERVRVCPGRGEGRLSFEPFIE